MLLCPSLSKSVELVASDEQKIDLGFIACSFGIDPATLKLNGHFISRGIDLIACSVTWKSLLSFFSAKGLSTGKDDRDALLVTGKLCKVGNKSKCIFLYIFVLGKLTEIPLISNFINLKYSIFVNIYACILCFCL